MVSRDGEVAMCMRVSEGAFKAKETGAGMAYYHRLMESTKPKPVERAKNKKNRKREIPAHVKEVAVRCARDTQLKAMQLKRLSTELGLSIESLERLMVGWSKDHAAWTFPMRNYLNEIVGIRLRKLNGSKLMVKGSDGSGIFVPQGLDVVDDLLIICEGPTDTAALLDLGLKAIGRPNNTAGTKNLLWFVVLNRPAEVVILHDRDEAGSPAEKNTLRGAYSLATILRSPKRTIRIIPPPEGFKDVREWKREGKATVEEIYRLIDQAKPITESRYEWMRNTR